MFQKTHCGLIELVRHNKHMLEVRTIVQNHLYLWQLLAAGYQIGRAGLVDAERQRVNAKR